MKLSIRTLALPLVAFGLLLAGCDSGGDDDGPSIEGNWEIMGSDFDANGGRYLEITSSTFTKYITTPSEVSCSEVARFDADAFDIVEQNGDAYTLEEQESGTTVTTVTLEIVREGSELTVRELEGNIIGYEEAAVYEPADVDPSECLNE